MSTTISPDELQAQLNHFCGTNAYHRLVIGNKLLFTDGVRFLAEKAGAFWLLDAIASHQPDCRKDPALQYMQFWTLKAEDGKGTLTCERDSDDVFLTQEIPFTDFPLPEIRIWVELADEDGTMVGMLPGER